MKLNKKIIAFLVISITATTAFSQSNFKKAYIIKWNNDTIHGLIDFRTDHQNAVVCKFQENETSPEQIFVPGSIRAYRFEDDSKYYISHEIVLDNVTQNVFLEFLVEGNMNLYYLPKGKGIYYFENSSGEMSEISQKDNVITKDGKLKVDNSYVGKLSLIFKDYMPLALNAKKVKFMKGPIIKYTVEYHNKTCVNGEECLIYENDYKKKFTQFDFQVYSGIEYNIFSRMYSITPLAGAGLKICSPRLTPALGLISELSISKLAGVRDYNYQNQYYVERFSAMKANLSYGMSFSFLEWKTIRPNVMIGQTLSYLFDYYKGYRTEFSEFSNYQADNLWKRGFVLGAGCEFKLKNSHYLSLNFRNYNSYTSTSTLLTVGYKL